MYRSLQSSFSLYSKTATIFSIYVVFAKRRKHAVLGSVETEMCQNGFFRSVANPLTKRSYIQYSNRISLIFSYVVASCQTIFGRLYILLLSSLVLIGFIGGCVFYICCIVAVTFLSTSSLVVSAICCWRSDSSVNLVKKCISPDSCPTSHKIVQPSFACHSSRRPSLLHLSTHSTSATSPSWSSSYPSTSSLKSYASETLNQQLFDMQAFPS